jgi:histidinol-phosphatase (PHP family)
LKIDLHNHTILCHHATGTIEDYIQTAIGQKIDIFGFSDHAPIANFNDGYRMDISQVDEYEKSILDFKAKYSSQIDIKLAYEVDFMDNFNGLEDRIIDAKVDYLIGSVHFISKWGFDNPQFIGEYQNKDIDILWSEYFQIITKMANSGKFDIVGHFDLLKVFKFLPKKDIRLLAKDAIKAIKKANMTIEVNSAGFRKPIGEQYPSDKLLEMIYESEIPITIGSDAHKIEDIGLNYDKTIELISKIGFKTLVSYTQRDKEIFLI